MTSPAEIGSSASSYQILAKIATGGMAEIYLARGASAEGIERYVVLKRIRRERATDTELVRMFLDEARIAAQLQHSNIAQVYDMGRLGNSYFFTMEYVHGETVRAILARSTALRTPIPIGSALAIAAGAAAGLHHAHERIGVDGKPLHIIHRDISPSNLMVSYEGQVKVVDFGVAKAAHRAMETQIGAVKGKITYLSPEQCRGTPPLDRRSDLFSLGIVLWEMLTSKGLWRRASDWENMTAIVSDPAHPPSSLRPDVPPALDALVLKLLAKDREQRFATGDEVVEAIETLAHDEKIQMSTSGLGRLVRDLFGRRPEPWIEMAVVEHSPKVVTVTGEALLLDDGPSDSLDRELRDVLDLSATTIAQPPSPHPSQKSGPVPALAVASAQKSGRTTLGVAPPPPRSESPIPAPPRRSFMLAIVIALAALGIGVALALLMWKFQPNREQQAAASHDAALVAQASDAAAVDAAVAETTIDAAASIDAAVPIDAAVSEKHTRTPKQPTPKQPTPAPAKPPTASELQEWLRADRKKDVVAACSKGVTAATAMICTEAACRSGDAKHAGSWYAIVKSSTSARPRLALIDQCKKSGVDLCGYDAILCGQ